jgi:multidrug efflux pump subunit AcrA (membrane-fusion protein)
MKKLFAWMLIVALAFGCGKEEKGELPDFKVVEGVETFQVVEKTVEATKRFSGFVIPDKNIFLTPKIQGYLLVLKKEPGDRVKRGEVVAVIDKETIEPDVKRAKAMLKELKSALREIEEAEKEVRAIKKSALANFKLAKKTYERFKKLLKEEAVSKQKFDEVEAQYLSAKANLEAVASKEREIAEKKKQILAKQEQVLAQLQKARTYLKYAYLRSTANGVVLRKLVDEGNLVSPRTPVYEIGVYPLKVKVFVESSLAGSLRLGEKVLVKVRNLKVSGKITEIEEKADPVSHKFGVEVEIGDVPVVPGEYAVVEIPVGKTSSLLVPKSAVFRVGALEYVFVVEGDCVHLRLIKTGKEVGDYVEVLSGLKAGEEVAISNLDQLYDGARIKG